MGAIALMEQWVVNTHEYQEGIIKEYIQFYSIYIQSFFLTFTSSVLTAAREHGSTG